jgi:catechol 2,3-dioxygenase-like lactoylglutathione lyase family enzyme
MPNQPSAAQQGDVSLDHVGFIVRDLAATHALLTRLGFTLTRRADHTRVNANGEAVSAGSAQHSIMLGDGYVELMQITDATAGHPLTAAAQLRFGLHVFALGTTDAQACHAQVAARGLNISPVAHWSRAVEEVSAKGLAQFAFFGAASAPTDPSYLCWVQHLTPDLLRPPGLTTHANGALGLAGVAFSGPQDQALAWSAQMVRAGARLAHQDDYSVLLQLHAASLHIHFDAEATTVLPSAMLLDVADFALLEARCSGTGVKTARLADGSLSIDLRAEFGMPWICKPKP